MADAGAPSKYDAGFAREVYGLENGSHVKKCMQCGMCAVSCATFQCMDHSPRRLFALIRAGRKEEVLRSNTPWMCTSCLMCKARCPRGIPIIDVMHDLKGLALREGKVPYPQAAIYGAYWKELAGRGKVFTAGMLRNYALKRGLGNLGKMMHLRDFGLRMFRHGRVPLMPPKAPKGKKQLMQMVKRAQELERKEAK